MGVRRRAGSAVTDRVVLAIVWVVRRLSRMSDEELLAATRAGQADAFAVFFARHGEGLVGFVRRRVGSAELAADLTAEVFAAALIATHRGHASEVPDGRAWLRGIARHKVADSYRDGHASDAALRQLRLQRVPLEGQDVRAIDRLGGVESPIHGALDQLSEQERTAVIERVVLERDYAHISERASTSQAVARKRVSRGLARLRKEMGADRP